MASSKRLIKGVARPGKRNRRLGEPLGVRVARGARALARALAIALPLPALAFGAWWAYGKVLSTPHLGVKSITVSGIERVPKEQVVALSGIREGQNLFSFSESEVASVLKANAWIESVELDRRLPDSVEIIVRERRPAVLVKLETLYIMDTGGVIFKRYSAEEDAVDIPVVTGLSPERLGDRERELGGRLLELISVLTKRQGFNITQVSEISVDQAHGLSIFTLEEGVRLDVGLDGFEEKLASFEKILGTRDGVLRGIEAFDLSNHREVVVRFVNDVVKRGGGANGKKG